MQAPPPAYNTATAAPVAAPVATVNPSDPQYAGGPPTSAPAAPHRSAAGHSYVGDWQTSCLGVCFSDPAICCYAELCLPCLLVSQRLELMRTHNPPLTEYTCCMERVGGQSENSARSTSAQAREEQRAR